MSFRSFAAMLSIVATIDAISLPVIFIGAGECRRGDGCLLFSLLLLLAFSVAIVVLAASGLMWLVGRKQGTMSRYFIASNLTLFAATAGTVIIAISYVSSS